MTLPFFFFVLIYTHKNKGLHVPQKEKAHCGGLSHYLMNTVISKGSL